MYRRGSDLGFNSDTRRANLQRGGDHHDIVCERLRSASADAMAARSRPGARSECLCVYVNPGPAGVTRSCARTASPTCIGGTDAWSCQRWDEFVGRPVTTGCSIGRRTTCCVSTKLREPAVLTHLDGRWIMRTSDDTLSPAELARAYKQLHEVQRGWRARKGVLRLRPVFHHRGPHPQPSPAVLARLPLHARR